jgi:protein subunit release factor B
LDFLSLVGILFLLNLVLKISRDGEDVAVSVSRSGGYGGQFINSSSEEGSADSDNSQGA